MEGRGGFGPSFFGISSKGFLWEFLKGGTTRVLADPRSQQILLRGSIPLPKIAS